MRIETHCEDRRHIADAIGRSLNAQVHYDGVPSCSYSVGPVTIARDGSISCEDMDTWRALQPLFESRGWLEGTRETRADESADPEPGNLLTIPLSDTTPDAITKLMKTLYARQNLINSMAKRNIVTIDEEMMELLNDMKPDTVGKISELVDTETEIGMAKGIAVDSGTFSIASPFESGEEARKRFLSQVLKAVADKALASHYVKCVKLEPEPTEMKYFCHSWLMQLGFGGAEHRDLRNALLSHLQGFAAFRTREQMEDHKERFIKRRREERQTREAGADEAN